MHFEETDDRQSLKNSTKSGDDDDMEHIQVDQQVLPPEDNGTGEDGGINEEESTKYHLEKRKKLILSNHPKKKVWYKKTYSDD